MKKGVYDMPNVYASKQKFSNIYTTSLRDKRENPKNKIAKSVSDDCVEVLVEGLTQFVNAITKTLMQEK